MANVVILQRNIKRGNVREFDDSYNRGFTDIWASEIDADFDTLYGAWNGLIGSTTETVMSPTPPTNPRVGDLWWRSTDGNMFIFYDDGNSQQFVPVSSTADFIGSGLPSGPAGGVLTGTYPNPGLGLNEVANENIITVDWTKITSRPATMPPSGPAGGVLVGNYPNPTNVLWSGVQGAPTTYPPSGPAGGALTGTYPSPGVDYNQLSNRPTIPTSLPPMGPAAGALIGTYPAPQLAIGAAIKTLTMAPNYNQKSITLTTESLIQEVTWTSAGGSWFVLAGIHGHLGQPATGPNTGITAQLRMDGTAGVATDGTVLAWQSFGGVATPSVSGSTIPGVVPFSVFLAGAGPRQVVARRAKLTAWINGQLIGNNMVDTSWMMICEPT